MIQLLKAIFFGTITIMIGGFILLILVSAVGMYSDGGTYEAYSRCQMRRIEAKVSDDIANVHTDYCMASEGYRRVRCSGDQTYLPSCYVSKFFVWFS